MGRAPATSPPAGAFGAWKSKAWPDGCRRCHRTDLRHNALGLCRQCYKLQPAGPEDNWPRNLARDPDFDFDTGEPVGGEPESRDDRGDPADVIEPPGERRPGTIASPPSDGTDAPGGAPRRTLRDRVRGAFSGPIREPKAERPPDGPERRPGRAQRRLDGAETIAQGVGFMGWLLHHNPRHVPVANCLQWQAPTSGEMLDEAVRDTIVDRRVLQPIVKTKARIGLFGAVLGPPAIVLAMEARPDAWPVLLPMLRGAIEESLPLMVPAMKRVRAKEAAKEEAARDLLRDFADEIPEGVDPVDFIIQSMFAGYVWVSGPDGATTGAATDGAGEPATDQEPEGAMTP